MNRCSALQLAKQIEGASVEANKIIQKWPNWEMGYVRKAGCQIELRDFHGAIRTLTQGLSRLPDSTSLLWRIRDLVSEEDAEISCIGNEPDTIISILRPGFLTTKLFAESFAPTSPPDLGMKIVTPFDPLIPVKAEAMEINGSPAEQCRFSELKHKLLVDLQAIVIVWRTPSSGVAANTGEDGISKPISRQVSNRVLMGGGDSAAYDNMDEAQLALRLSAVPQSYDQVIVFGSGQQLCNGDFYPQGTRNERPWFENESGVCLSYEQAESGTCGWILGNPINSKIHYVLRPGHEPRGEDFGEWLAVNRDEDNPPPSFVGVGDKVPSLKKLTMWIKSPNDSNVTTRTKTMVPHLLGLKGHGIRLFEGGWYKEAIEVFDLIIDQALALAVGDERCPSVELARIAENSREVRRQCIEQLKLHIEETHKMDMQVLFDGFTLTAFDDPLVQVEFKVIDLTTLQLKQIGTVSQNYRPPPKSSSSSSSKRFGIFSVFGCARATPNMMQPVRPTTRRKSSTVEVEQWNRDSVTLNIVSMGTPKRFVLSNKTLNKTWEMNTPLDEKIISAFQQWLMPRQNLPIGLSAADIGWI